MGCMSGTAVARGFRFGTGSKRSGRFATVDYPNEPTRTA